MRYSIKAGKTSDKDKSQELLHDMSLAVSSGSELSMVSNFVRLSYYHIFTKPGKDRIYWIIAGCSIAGLIIATMIMLSVTGSIRQYIYIAIMVAVWIMITIVVIGAIAGFILKYKTKKQADKKQAIKQKKILINKGEEQKQQQLAVGKV